MARSRSWAGAGAAPEPAPGRESPGTLWGPTRILPGHPGIPQDRWDPPGTPRDPPGPPGSPQFPGAAEARSPRVPP